MTAHERLAAIHAHLDANGQIMVVTYAKVTIYKKKHRTMFTATEKDLFVARGRHKDCLNFTEIRFSR